MVSFFFGEFFFSLFLTISPKKKKTQKKTKNLSSLSLFSTYPSRRQPPPLDVLLRVRPQQVAHRPLVRHLLLPVYRAEAVERGHRRAEPAVHGKDAAVVDRGGQREVVEAVGAGAPHVGVAVLAHALVVEAVDLRDLPRLVVPPDQGHPVRVAHLEREEQQKSLDRVEAPVDKVAQEEVGGPRGVPSRGEELLEVVKLPVDVPADGDGRGDLRDVPFLDQQLDGRGAELLGLALGQRAAGAELGDPGVEVHFLFSFFFFFFLFVSLFLGGARVKARRKREKGRRRERERGGRRKRAMEIVVLGLKCSCPFFLLVPLARGGVYTARSERHKRRAGGVLHWRRRAAGLLERETERRGLNGLSLSHRRRERKKKTSKRE